MQRAKYEINIDLFPQKPISHVRLRIHSINFQFYRRPREKAT